MNTKVNVTLENYHTHQCFEHLHDDGHPCRMDRGLDGMIGGCQQRHTPRLKWTEHIENLVTTEGKNKLLDAGFKTGLASPAWYVGLVDNVDFTAYAAGDTSAKIVHATPAGGDNQWREIQPYSNSTRVAWTPGSVAAGSVDNSASKAVFNINATAVVRGAFISTLNTVFGITGTLYGEGDYSVSRSVYSGDTLNVTITVTAS